MKYFIYDLTDGVKHYIGSTKDIDVRIRMHFENCFDLHCKNHHILLYDYIRKTGKQHFSFKILAEIDVLTKTDARIIERSEYDKIPPSDRLNSIVPYRTELERLEYIRNVSKKSSTIERQKIYENQPEIKARRNQLQKERLLKRKQSYN